MFQKPNEPLEFPALSWVQLVREQPRLQPEYRHRCQSKYCLNRDVSFPKDRIQILFWLW